MLDEQRKNLKELIKAVDEALQETEEDAGQDETEIVERRRGPKQEVTGRSTDQMEEFEEDEDEEPPPRRRVNPRRRGPG
jgi:hypothetical protein